MRGWWFGLVIAAGVVGCASAPLTADKRLPPVFFAASLTGWEHGGPGTGAPLALAFEFELDSGVRAQVGSCEEAAAVDPARIEPTDFHRVRRLQVDCRAVQQFAVARPATVSFFEGRVVTRDALEKLPASVQPPLTRDPHPPEADAKSLKAVEQLGEFELRDDDSWVLVGERSMYVLEVLAWGDFNGDGVDDVMVRVDWRALDAFGRGTSALVLTRDAPEALLRVLTRLDH